MYFIFVKFIISSIRLRCLEKPLSDNKLFFILLYGFWRIAYFYCLINKSGNGGLFFEILTKCNIFSYDYSCEDSFEYVLIVLFRYLISK